MGKRLTIDELEQRLYSRDCSRKSQARVALWNRRDEIPIEMLERWLRESNDYVHQTAMKICQSNAEYDPETMSTSVHIPVDVAERWIQDSNVCMRLAAMFVCFPPVRGGIIADSRKDIPLTLIEHGLRDDDYTVFQAADYVRQNYGGEIPAETIKRWAEDDNPNLRKVAPYACNQCKNSEIPWEVIIQLLTSPDDAVRNAAVDFFMLSERVPIEVKDRLSRDPDPNIRVVAVDSCVNTPSSDAMWEIIERCLKDSDEHVVDTATLFCSNRPDIPTDVLERWSADADYNVRLAAYENCRDDIPWEIIDRGLCDADEGIRYVASYACLGRKGDSVPLDLLKKWVESSDPSVRSMSVFLCGARDDVWPIIEKGLLDDDESVQAAAKEVCGCLG